jgi:signal transduction histidine kinase
MRSRLIGIYVTMLAVVFLGLSVPLATYIADSRYGRMYDDRQSDTARFASVAESVLRTGHAGALAVELQQYEDIFGVGAAVVARDGAQVVVASSGHVDVNDPLLREPIDDALSGQYPERRRPWWPWQSDPMVIAEPIGQGGEVIGAAVTVSPNNALRTSVWHNWGLLAGGSALAMSAAALASLPLTRWILRPVDELDKAAHTLAAGEFRDGELVARGPAELQRLTDSFNTMSSQVANMVERQQAFASHASHQLKAPLASMLLWLDNLRPSVTEDGLDDHAMVTEEVRRLAVMCEALLAYARSDATAREATTVDAAEVADERVAIWLQAAAEADITLVRTGAETVLARTAVQALDQSIDALLSNAIKFAGEGGSVEVSVGRHNGWVEVAIRDDGPGMAVTDLSLPKQPFWRGPEHQNDDGSGLGITIADALVSASGGHLTLSNVRPHGLHALIRLPVANRSLP